jgi:hypothetical protein
MRTSPPAFSRFGSALGLAALLLSALAGGSCSALPQPPTVVFDFHVETPTGTGIALNLPVTQQVKYCQSDSFLDESNVVDVKLGTIDVSLGDGQIMKKQCALFYFNREGDRQMELQTQPDHFGKKIFLLASDQAGDGKDKYIGVRPIDQIFTTGPFFMFMEIPDADSDPAKLAAVVDRMKASVDQAQKVKKGT